MLFVCFFTHSHRLERFVMKFTHVVFMMVQACLCVCATYGEVWKDAILKKPSQIICVCVGV